jgi:hypothetical protein
MQPQIVAPNSLTSCNTYQGQIERLSTEHQYQHQASPDHLPPTPYSYDPSTPCPSQQTIHQPISNRSASEHTQIVIDNQNGFLREAASIRSPDHYPPTPYSSDPPTPYAANGTNSALHTVYCSPEHDAQKDGKISVTGLEFDHLPPTPYSLDLCSPNSERSSELVQNPANSLINRFSHRNDQNNQSFFSPNYDGELKNLTQRDEIISSNSNDKHLISQKSHKEIKDLSLHKTTETPTNG